ncbi:Ig-like domain-containing protein [Hymenobacter sp. B81]|uniref:Ig-like domain-containing protein n=1 Tax=Hymenobacter sp. B81 TaxID=3344878 RepID=UPI0037DD83DB
MATLPNGAAANTTLSASAGVSAPNSQLSFSNIVSVTIPSYAPQAQALSTSVSYRAAVRTRLPALAATDANGEAITRYALTIPSTTLGTFYLGETSTAALSGTVAIAPTEAGNLFFQPGGTLPSGSNAASISATYTASSGPANNTLTSPATAYSVTVTDSAPRANNDAVATLASTAVAIRVLGNDTDGDGTADINVGSVEINNVSNGSVSVNNSTGVVTFTPAGAADGSFTYTIADARGQRSTPATVTVGITTATADVVARLTAPAGGTAPAGSFVTYALTLRNTGSSTAARVAGRIQLPTGLANVTASNNQVYDPNTGLVQFFPVDLASGAERTHAVTLVTPVGGTLLVTGSSTSSGTADPDPANNDGSLADARVTTTITQVADVAATLTGPSAAGPSVATVLNITAVNHGPSTATGVVLRAVISAGLNNVGVSGGGSYDPNTGIITLPAIGSLDARVSRGFTVRFTAPANGTITGSAAASSTTANGDPFAGNNDGSFSTIQVRVSNTVTARDCLPDVPAGTVTTTANQQLNTYYPGEGTAQANTNTLSVGPHLATTGAASIGPGDLVLIMQMQGADINATNSEAYGDGSLTGNEAVSGVLSANLTAGNYEYRYVAASSATAGAQGGQLTFTQPLTHTYVTAPATASAGQRRYQVIRIPRFNNLTLGAPLAPPAWDGQTGGVLALEANGLLNFNGQTIDASGRGFRGGAGRQLARTGGEGTPTTTDFAQPSSVNVHGSKGEGIAGTPRYVNNGGNGATDLGSEGYPGGSHGRGAPGNAGGGGTDGNISNNENNTGGGGGSNGGSGGQGGNAWGSATATGGNGGAPFLAASPSRVVMGGGGGAGTTNDGTGTLAGGVAPTTPGFASSGTAGGGIVIINANQVSGTGIINVSGAHNTATVLNDGSGGGGAGGTVVLLASFNAGAITVLANGGTGGSNTGDGRGSHGPGGGGSAGVVYTSSPVTVQAQPGQSGVTNLTSTNGSVSLASAYGASAGTQFSSAVRNNLTQGDLPNITRAANNCTSQPLPVVLARFDAKAKGTTAVLTWSTAQELNNARFEVERSADGLRYARVATLAGQGTTAQPTHYTYTDRLGAKLAPQYYYRLRQIDVDGTADVSPVRVVVFGPHSAQVTLTPNPASRTVLLDLSAFPEHVYTITVTDMLGRQVLTQTLDRMGPVPIAIDGLRAGAYLLTVGGPATHVVKRFIKQD